MEASENNLARVPSLGALAFGERVCRHPFAGHRGEVSTSLRTALADPPRSHAEIFSLIRNQTCAAVCGPAENPATTGFGPGSHLLTFANVSALLRSADHLAQRLLVKPRQALSRFASGFAPKVRANRRNQRNHRSA